MIGTKVINHHTYYLIYFVVKEGKVFHDINLEVVYFTKKKIEVVRACIKVRAGKGTILVLRIFYFKGVEDFQNPI